MRRDGERRCFVRSRSGASAAAKGARTKKKTKVPSVEVQGDGSPGGRCIETREWCLALMSGTARVGCSITGVAVCGWD